MEIKSHIRRIRMILTKNSSYAILSLISASSICCLLYCMFSSRCIGTPEGSPSPHGIIKRQLVREAECYLFLIIITSPKGEIRRKAIRDTWLKLESSPRLVQKRFFIGTKSLDDSAKSQLVKEQTEHQDLLFLNNFADSYEALTEKLLRSILWVSENVNAKFVMKIDDDSFVRLNILLSDLKLKEHLQRLYWGFFRGNAKVKQLGLWEEPNWFLSDHYLPYALGGGYILSNDLVMYVASNSHMLQFYKSEDVSLGVWLAPVKLNRIHDTRFDTEYKSKGCNNTDVVSHKQEERDMYAKYAQLMHHGHLCERESEVLLTYEYNWKVPPSQCCKRVKRSKLV